jgi:hypothetical protein
MVALVTACGGDGAPGGYGASHRASFVDECTTEKTNRRTCGCFYDRVAEDVPFDRFEELDHELVEPLAETPADLAALAAGCAARHQSTDGS